MQKKQGFTLIEIIVTLVILGIIILVGIQVPNRLLKKHRKMEKDSDIYSDVMMINESLGKDIRNSTSENDINIVSSGEFIDYIDISINKNSDIGDYGINTVTHRYSFEYDSNPIGIYRSIDGGTPKRITNEKFYRFESDSKDRDLLVLGIKENIMSEDEKKVIASKPKILIKYSLKANSLQKKKDIDYPLVNQKGASDE